MTDAPRRGHRWVYLAMLSPIILMLTVFGAAGSYLAYARGLRGEEIGAAMNRVAFPAALLVFAGVFLFGRWCARRDGLSLSAIGWNALTPRRAALGVVAGIAGGLLFTFVAAPLVQRVNPAFDPVLKQLTLVELLFLQLVGVAGEDTVFRGYPLVRLREKLRPWMAVAISALFYALLNLTQGPASAAWAYLFGVGLGALFYSTGSLWPVAIAHYLVAIAPRLLQ